MIYILLCFLLNFIDCKIIINEDIFVESSLAEDLNKSILPKNSEVFVLNSRINTWYELKKEKGFVESNCAEARLYKLCFVNDCKIRKNTSNSSAVLSTILKGECVDSFLVVNTKEYEVLFENSKFWVLSDYLSLVREKTNSLKDFEPVSFSTIYKLNPKETIVSPFIDKTVYISTLVGVFISHDSKKWYRLKNLDDRKYQIVVTKDGYLIADNLISKDYGKTFTDFFPIYAFPYYDTIVKKIMISDNENSIYITFASKSNDKDMTLFMKNIKDDFWVKVYPSIDGENIVKIPIINIKESIISFIKTNWMLSNKRYNKTNLVNFDIDNFGNDFIATMILDSHDYNQKTVMKHQVVLLLNFSYDKGWAVKDEKWRFI